MGQNHEQIYQRAQDWVREAGAMVKNFLENNEILHETKSHQADLVTVADRSVEKFLVELIQKHYPDHKLLGEEGMGENTKEFSGYVWLIDPIDGTANFVSQQADFVISVGLYLDQQGVFGIVYDVMRDEMIHALKGKGVFFNDKRIEKMDEQLALIDSMLSYEHSLRTEAQVKAGQKLLELYPRVRGIRSYGVTALSLARVAIGRVNGFITMGTNPWDHAAGAFLVQEAGGKVTDFDGNDLPLDRRSSVIACNPGIYDEILQFIRERKIHV
ncbi:inositol monophosphatase family protein [Paenactinomyces guangxiensis]|uniref:Inositol-1-monophosphatase n=1 Tax=Paenactinomyces guangxiensis TaxID=1490290 RepID=A0A7W1WU06_9BACL|nr:inositol monophosphatase [Paenactinomyces guangxiensis]MBA4496030.1 inositol monophosphatase [Paenactinomyces guangxiensis]MBH8593094.1 inositol monophosphatase [Paenactinomyces guangxiensis]